MNRKTSAENTVSFLPKRPLPDIRTGYRVAAASFYFIQGFAVTAWVSRLPEIKSHFALSDSSLGLLLLAPPAGQLAAMPLSGGLVRRFGSFTITRIAGLLLPCWLPVLGTVSGSRGLFAALFFFGMATNLSNISVNTQCVGVERLYGKSIMASFHGVWSLGGIGAVLLSSYCANHGISPKTNFLLATAVSVFVYLLNFRRLLPRDRQTAQQKSSVSAKRDGTAKSNDEEFAMHCKYGDAGDFEGRTPCGTPRQSGKSALLQGARRRVGSFGNAVKRLATDRFLWILGFISLGCLGCEGVMNNWSAIYFQQSVTTEPQYIRTGLLVYMLFLTGNRFTADRFVRKWGGKTVIRLSGVLIAAGMTLLTCFPFLLPAAAGCALIGLGTSAIVPVCYGLAGKHDSVPTATAITMVAGIGFSGFLVMPALAGGFSGWIGLKGALFLVGVFSFLTTLPVVFLKSEKPV